MEMTVTCSSKPRIYMKNYFRFSLLTSCRAGKQIVVYNISLLCFINWLVLHIILSVLVFRIECNALLNLH